MSSAVRLLLICTCLSMLVGVSQAIQPGEVTAVEADGSSVTLRTDSEVLVVVSFLRDDLFRITAGLNDVESDEGSGVAPIVVLEPSPDVDVKVIRRATHHLITTPNLALRIYPSPLRFELYRSNDTTPLWRELKPLAIDSLATVQTLDSDRFERFYGGGQQNGAYEFNGELMEISYSGGWEEGDRPSPAPFYMSSRGYGVLRNTWADGVYDFRSSDYLTAAHAEPRFDAYYMVADDVRGVLDLYTRLTGRAPLLPRWAFGYGDADCYNDGDNVDKPGTVPAGWSDGPTGTTPDVVASVARKYREHDMPGGWILPNDGYGCGYTDLPEVVAGLRKLGFRTGLWTENGVEKIAWEVGTAGTRVQKLDVAWTGKGYQWALDANHDAAQGFLDNSDARPFIWTVMGWAGIQRYAVTWTGDQSGSWDYIRWHVPTLIGSGLSGMNYSTGDVDGIFGGSPETFTRDLQWKCFTSVFMGMSGWSKAERKHPWWFDEPYRSINRRYMKLRQRLMPIIYTLARETATTGAPMVRGLLWDHPGDPHAGTEDYPYQFFLGRDLLVAPVYRSESSSGGWREGVHLPQGRWIDYWTGQVVEAGAGGEDVDVPVDLATLPVFVSGGAIIPMYPESLYDGQVPADPLTLDVYPRGHSEFVLYEDDGDTRAYREGAFSTQGFTVSAPKHGAGPVELTAAPVDGSFDGMLRRRSLVVLLHTRVTPELVALDGAALPWHPTRSAFDAADAGWHFDPDDRYGVIHVKTGPLDMGVEHHLLAEIDPRAELAATPPYPRKPAGDGTVPVDALMVVNRAAEEPGHPLENAFDGDPATWFRSVRDQSAAYGPHEFVLSLGERRMIEGFRIAPRNDKYWEYGQVRSYELYLADVNGEWGEPVSSGSIEKSEGEMEVRFAPKAGSLMRFRVLSTHDMGADPMVLGANSDEPVEYDALAPVLVSPVTISEFRLLEFETSTGAPVELVLAKDGVVQPSASTSQVFLGQNADKRPMVLGGLPAASGFGVVGAAEVGWGLDMESMRLMEGPARTARWIRFRADVGLDDASPPAVVRFQIHGDGRLLWDSGPVAKGDVMKPRLDIRGVSTLVLGVVTDDEGVMVDWTDAVVEGY